MTCLRGWEGVDMQQASFCHTGSLKIAQAEVIIHNSQFSTCAGFVTCHSQTHYTALCQLIRHVAHNTLKHTTTLGLIIYSEHT